MKNILIVFRDRNKKFADKTTNIVKNKFPNSNIKSAWKNKLISRDFENKNLIITIGGDGTFLSASHFNKDIPMVGINYNPQKSEGALTSGKISNFELKLDKILNKKFKIKKHTRIKVKIIQKNKCILTKLSLNEVYIGNKNPHHISTYRLKKKNKSEMQKSSGILISTGTGSSAWYKSMGGKTFSKIKNQIKFIVREPIRGRISQPKMLKGKINKNSELKITNITGHSILSIDSIRRYDLKKGDEIILSIGKPLNIIY